MQNHLQLNWLAKIILLGLLVCLSLGIRQGTMAQPLNQSASPFGPEAIWKPPAQAQQATLQCFFEGKDTCLIEEMQRSGASEAALAFARAFGGEAYLDSFYETGIVDLGAVIYPTRANDNFQGVLLNGVPPIVMVEDVKESLLKNHPDYSAMKARYPKMMFWPTDNRFGMVEALPGGGQAGRALLSSTRFTMAVTPAGLSHTR